MKNSPRRDCAFVLPFRAQTWRQILDSALPKWLYGPVINQWENNRGIKYQIWPLESNCCEVTWKSRPLTQSVTSLKRWFSNNRPRSSARRHSGTLNWTALDWPEMLTLSATTLTFNREKEQRMSIRTPQKIWWQRRTSQKSVNLSSGKRPFASSRRKSRRINFLKPQSFPWTNL
jgi:hypothetical protein